MWRALAPTYSASGRGFRQPKTSAARTICPRTPVWAVWSRTIISSGTTFLTVLALYLFGGEVLRGFAFTMVIGIIVGTYSTIYIASPIVVWWDAFRRKKQTRPAARAAL